MYTSGPDWPRDLFTSPAMNAMFETIVCGEAFAFWKLSPRQNMVSIHVVLKKYLASRIEIQYSAVHASNIERQ